MEMLPLSRSSVVRRSGVVYEEPLSRPGDGCGSGASGRLPAASFAVAQLLRPCFWGKLEEGRLGYTAGGLRPACGSMWQHDSNGEDLRLDSLLKASGSDVVDAIATKPLRCFLASDAPQFALLSGLEVGRWQAMHGHATFSLSLKGSCPAATSMSAGGAAPRHLVRGGGWMQERSDRTRPLAIPDACFVFFQAGCPAAMVGCRSLEAEAAMALGALPVLEALALANVHATWDPLKMKMRCNAQLLLSVFVFWQSALRAEAGDVLLQSFWQGRLQPAARSSLRSLSLEGAHGATLQGFPSPRLRIVHVSGL